MKKELTPTSNVDKALLVGDEYISQVRTFGVLGYTPNRICHLLGLREKERAGLIYHINEVGDTYHDAYINGRALGEYNIDVELAKLAEKGDIDAITTLESRKNLRVELDLRKELFGV
ncbi:MAG: hypothetical protein LBU44_09675 [Mediterranea sp.]|jgi:hypothetical protein|nr:hypothetical protein [Mediterranea sp.]